MKMQERKDKKETDEREETRGEQNRREEKKEKKRKRRTRQNKTKQDKREDKIKEKKSQPKINAVGNERKGRIKRRTEDGTRMGNINLYNIIMKILQKKKKVKEGTFHPKLPPTQGQSILSYKTLCIWEVNSARFNSYSSLDMQ